MSTSSSSSYSNFSRDKSTKTDDQKSNMIPLRHIDKINSSINNLNKLNVIIKNDNKSSDIFQISGECPVHISAFNSNNVSIKEANIQIGDYIIEINGQNVSRGSAKSVRKILKSSNVLNITLYRADDKSRSKLFQNTNIKSTSSTVSSSIRSSRNNMFNLISNSIKNSWTGSDNITSTKQICFKSLISCMGIASSSTRAKLLLEDKSTDDGYYSIPRTNSARLTSLDSCSSIRQSETESIIEEPQLNIASTIINMKQKIDQFLNELQSAIQVYVRPSTIFKILTTEQSLELFQNIEKLIPVTKFMLGIVNSFEFNQDQLPNAESLKIVFDSFKVYLNGLPKSIRLLEQLYSTNSKFSNFLQDQCVNSAFKLFDILFLPLEFVKSIVDFIQCLQTCALSINNEDSFNNDQRLKQIVADIYQCTIQTYSELEDKFNAEKEVDDSGSITTVSECSDFFSVLSSTSGSSSLSDSLPQITPIKKLSIQFRESNSNTFLNGFLLMDSTNLQIQLENREPFDLGSLKNIRKSKNCNKQIYFKLDECLSTFQSSHVSYITVRFENELIRDEIYEKLADFSSN